MGCFSAQESGACMYDLQVQLINISSTFTLRGLKVGGSCFCCFCFVFKISSIPSCLKNIWRCGTFLEYVVEDLVLSSWTGKTGSSHLLSARLYHGHVYLYSNTGLIEIGNLCIFINVLFCTSVSQRRCSRFCEVFRCMF